jgi:nitrite reductase/ring-hydroxylating ferredoxin subunit
VAEAERPAPEFYLRPENFARERRAIFATAWLPLGRGDRLAAPGDYICASLGGWPVFAIRDETGACAAFRNQCRHQGLAVLESGTGNCAELRCRYHGWRYDFAGRFRAAPPLSAPADPGDPMHNLAAVAAESWAGLVFVHFGAAPPPLRAGLEDAPDLAGLRCHAEIATDIEANWKIVVEHCLGLSEAVGRRYLFPCLVIAGPADGVVVWQVIARSFQRTRLVAHCYEAASGAGAERAAQAVQRSAAERQVGLAAGGDIAPPPSPDLRAFHHYLRAVDFG